MISTIAFDGDDTLWHNETIFQNAQEAYTEILSNYADIETVKQFLFHQEQENLKYYGYGIKSFILSSIEAAIKITKNRITAEEIFRIIGMGKDMIHHPVKPLEHIPQVLKTLRRDGYTLMIITKGDLFDQEAKIEQSGLHGYVHYVEIVSEKNEEVYGTLLKKYTINPKHFLMVGNSLKSDILPVVNIGASAIHIPYHVTWEHEAVQESVEMKADYQRAESIKDVPSLVSSIKNIKDT